MIGKFIESLQSQAEGVVPDIRRAREWHYWLKEKQPALYSLMEYESPALGYADVIRLQDKVDPFTARTSDGALIRTYRYRGSDRSNSSLTERARFNARIAKAFDDFSEGWSIWPLLDRFPSDNFPKREYPDRASWLVGEEMKREFETHRYYESETYISVQYMPPAVNKGNTKLYKLDTEDFADHYAQAKAEFDQRCIGFEQTFGSLFELEPLGVRAVNINGKTIHVDDQLALFSRILTGKRQQLRAIPNYANIAAYVASETFIHRDEVVRVGSTLFRPISVVDFPWDTTPNILDALDHLAGEVIASWRWITEDQDRAIKEIKKVRGGASMRKESTSKQIFAGHPDSLVDRDAVSAMDDAEEAYASARAKQQRFGYFTLTIAPLVRMQPGESEEEARKRLSSLSTEVIGLLGARFLATSEELGNEAEALRAMCPGQHHDNVILPMLGTRSLADFIPTTHTWKGYQKYDARDEFHAGMDPLLTLATHGRTTFSFVHSLPGRGGNVLVLGDPRTGKSSFAGLLTNQYRQFKPKLPNGCAVIIIDKGKSHFVQCKAVGGEHITLSPDTTRGFALFWDIETPSGFNRCLTKLSMMITEVGGDARALAGDLFLALEAFRSVHRDQRNLSAFCTGVQMTKAIKEKLTLWSRDGFAGNLYEATIPSEFRSDFIVYEIEPLESDLALKRVTLYCLLDEIDRITDGSRPYMVMGEELWTLAGNPETDKHLIRFLKDKPKKGVSTILVTHNLADLDRSVNPKAYIDACGTRVLFPSDSLRTEDNIRRLRDIGATKAQLLAHAENSGRHVALIIQGNHQRMVAIPMGNVTRATVALSNERERNTAEYMMETFGEHWYPELVFQMTGEQGEGWRRHAYYYPPPPETVRVPAPVHANTHHTDPMHEVPYAS